MTKTIGRPRKDSPRSSSSPLKEMRLNLFLSQEQLAMKIGVAVSTISRWEKGEAEPTMTLAQTKRFTRLVGKSIEELPDSLRPHRQEK